MVSEQHPGKQGLKHLHRNLPGFVEFRLRATSRKTRIETSRCSCTQAGKTVSEQHPGKQGLKRPWTSSMGAVETVSEQHPGKQGLKLGKRIPRPIPEDVSEQHPGKQGLKLLYQEAVGVDLLGGLRATSRKTRIETSTMTVDRSSSGRSQSNIQENKD